MVFRTRGRGPDGTQSGSCNHETDEQAKMTIRDSLNLVPATTVHNRLRGSRIARSVVAAGVLASGLLVAGCMETVPGVAVSEPDPDLVFVRGYRSRNDACKLTGESTFTADLLDDAADLVTCPTGHPAATSLIAATNATVVTQTNSFTLFSVPRR